MKDEFTKNLIGDFNITNMELIKLLCENKDTKRLAEFLKEAFNCDDENFGCMSCTTYGTHHYPELCGKCYWRDIENDIEKWLNSKVETGTEEDEDDEDEYEDEDDEDEDE